ncbi:uncharacterized protein EI97DRAFT_358578, partial [Westerdykella ornata]
MAKTAKVKKRQATIHSRAARRAVSPSIDLDKSIKTATPDSPKQKAAKPHVLASQNAGVSKKTKSKPLKRQQRLRHLKGLERAADNLDKLELKVQKSVAREKNVRERRKGWEEVNGERRDKKQRNPFEALEEGNFESSTREREWVSDEEMPEVAG